MACRYYDVIRDRGVGPLRPVGPLFSRKSQKREATRLQNSWRKARPGHETLGARCERPGRQWLPWALCGLLGPLGSSAAPWVLWVLCDLLGPLGPLGPLGQLGPLIQPETTTLAAVTLFWPS